MLQCGTEVVIVCEMLSNICSDDKCTAHVREECILHAGHIVPKLLLSSRRQLSAHVIYDRNMLQIRLQARLQIK